MCRDSATPPSLSPDHVLRSPPVFVGQRDRESADALVLFVHASPLMLASPSFSFFFGYGLISFFQVLIIQPLIKSTISIGQQKGQSQGQLQPFCGLGYGE